MRALRPLRRALLIAASLLAFAPLVTTADAQGSRRTRLTLSGLPLTVTQTSVADYINGFVSIGVSNYSVWLRTNAGGTGFSPRVTTVNVACLAPCPASGTSANRLQWRRVDLGVWNDLTTTYTFVEARTVAFTGGPDPSWANQLEWRYTLDWATVPPAAATQYILTFQLVVTAP